MKINYTELQNNSEIETVKKFLPFFNIKNNSDFQNTVKNDVQDEVDVFCFDKRTQKTLKIQVKKADPVSVGGLGKSIRIHLSTRPFITRDQDQAEKRILANIRLVEDKYLKQGKNMSDIILLLEDIFDPAFFIVEKIKNQITSSIFKEIWLVTRNNVYKIY